MNTGSRKSEATKDLKTPAKYCSERCKNRKPGKVDRRIEDTFVALLNGADATSLAAHPANLAADAPVPAAKPETIHKKKIVKGDPRITVMCEEVETIIFGSRFDPEKTHGRKRNKAKRTLGDDSEDDDGTDTGSYGGAQSVNGASIVADNSAADSGSEDDNASDTSTGGVALPANTINDRSKENGKSTTPTTTRTDRHGNVLSDHKNFGAGKVRPAQLDAEVNFSVGGERGWAEKLEETPDMLDKRREGQKRADERESVRCAARRLCAFGYKIEGEAAEKFEESEDGGKRKKGKGKKSVRGVEEEDDQKPNREGKEKVRMKKCEAIMSSAVVEASFAKGEWGIRWREDQSK